MSLLDPRRHTAARPPSPPQPEPPVAPPARAVPFFGGTIHGTANVSVYVHPAADLTQLAYARAIIDKEMEARA